MPVEMTEEQYGYIRKHGIASKDIRTGPWTWEWYDAYSYLWRYDEAQIWRSIVTEAVGER